MFTLQTSFKPRLLEGTRGGGGTVSRGDCENSQLRPRIQPLHTFPSVRQNEYPSRAVTNIISDLRGELSLSFISISPLLFSPWPTLHSVFMSVLYTSSQCCRFMTFWSGSGSGSADLCLWQMDPDLDADPVPAIFIIDLQDAKKTSF